MPNTILIKRRTSGSAGSPASLAVGELAFNEVDDSLWIGKTGSNTLSIGGPGSFVTLTSNQTISGIKTFTGATVLGTPASGTLTNCTGLPVSTGLSGLGSNVATFLATPSSTNLASAVTDETGSGSLVFATSPVLVTPNLGTPSAGTLTNCTGLTLTTGVTGTLPVANGGTGVTSSTGSGSVVLSASPTLTGTVGCSNLTSTGNIIVGGNLTVNGTTTTVNSTITTLDDPIITLGGDAAPTSDDNKDRGVEFQWHNGSSAKTGFFGFDDSSGYMVFIPDATNTSEVFSGTLGDFQATNFRGNLVGNADTVTNGLYTSSTIDGGTF